MELCPQCGFDPELTEAAAEVDAAEIIAEGAEGAAHEEAQADVEVARINAERDVEVAKLDIKREEIWQEARVAELEGQVTGMREILDRLTAPPEPPPAPDPAPDPAPAEIVSDPPAPEETTPKTPAPKKRSGWWG